MRGKLLIAAAIGLSGCVSAGNQSTPSSTVASAPLSFDAAKQIVLAEKGTIWKDPQSIQGAAIGQPYSCSGGLAHVGQMPDACVCVAANAKNGFGGYTGIKRTELLLSGRTIVDMLPPREPTYSCGPLVPFPELNGDYIAFAPAASGPPAAKRAK